MPTTEFRPEVHGFPFANRFVNEVARLPTGDRIRTSGRCGGMSYGALDIFYSDRHAPDLDWSAAPRGVPPDGTPIADFLLERQYASFARTSAVRFIAWTLLPSHHHFLFKGVDTWTAEEVPKVCESIDRGRPCVLGMVGASKLSDVGKRNHQVVAFGYERTADGVRFLLYDCNTPRVTVRLEWKHDGSGVAASNRKQLWRGFFLHSYDMVTPPDTLWGHDPSEADRTTGTTDGPVGS